VFGLDPFDVIPVLFGPVVAVVLIVCGVRLHRRAAPVGRVAIEAILVDRHWRYLSKAYELTFDYPGPDGRWLRATRLAGLRVVRRSGWFTRPGDKLTVFVNPSQPLDVTLGQMGSYSGFMGIVMIVAGAIWALNTSGMVLDSLYR